MIRHVGVDISSDSQILPKTAPICGDLATRFRIVESAKVILYVQKKDTLLSKLYNFMARFCKLYNIHVYLQIWFHLYKIGF